MPNWPEFVKAQLGSLRLNPERETEIVAELGDHFQDIYEQLCRQGLADGEAIERALGQVSDWSRLRQDIGRAERGAIMSDRWGSLWLPGAYALAAFFGFLFGLGLIRGVLAGFLQRNYGIAPTVWRREPLFAALWLLMLAATGALAACLSRRAGGGRR